jgi:hypothetical protein
MNVAMSLRAKGFGGYVSRLGTIASRFGFGEIEMRRALDRYVALTDSVGAAPTFAIPAVVLSRHPAMVSDYVRRGVEFAVHGLVHGDHLTLSAERQARDISRAARRFRECGIEAAGFRGPYLRYARSTNEVLRSLGFAYHSSQAIHYAVLDPSHAADASYRRALTFYRAWDADRVVSRPRDVDGLLHIPVAIPDDEILVDRLRLGPDAQMAAWRSILEITHSRGELFTLQLHPERIRQCERALRSLLADARALGDVWIAQLREVATWWNHRRAARIEILEAGAGGYIARLRGSGALSLVLTRSGLPPELIPPERTVELESIPAVGLAPDAPEEVAAFLRDEGYLVERSLERSRFGTFLNLADGWTERSVLAELASARGPLVRIARWPAGKRSALAVTGDIDSITYRDFMLRLWETR